MKRSVFLLSMVCLSAFGLAPAPAAVDQWVYIGTYTGGKSSSKGIYLYGLDSTSGKLTPEGLAAEVERPSFVVVHPSKKFLYAVSELGPKKGGVSSFSIDPKSGKLALINQQPSQGSGPCHVNVDHSGKVLLVANYGSGHVASYPLQEDGSIGEAVSVVQQGPASGVNARRQEGPHAHSFYTDPTNRYALSCDLGCDRVFVYKLDVATAKLTGHEEGNGIVPPGGGPRHFAFHPNGKFGYACNELTMAVTAFAYDAEKGALTALETVSTLPEGVENQGYSTAEVQVHPSGKFVYVSNRGHHSIALFAVDEATGKLTFVEAAPSVVKTPRNFGVDPTGRWLIAAGQDSNDLVVFAINEATGRLKETGVRHDEVGSPVCVKFLTLE